MNSFRRHAGLGSLPHTPIRRYPDVVPTCLRRSGYAQAGGSREPSQRLGPGFQRRHWIPLPAGRQGLEFTPYLIRGRNDETVRRRYFMDRL